MLPVYQGKRYQRGGGILSSIARFAMPTVKKFATEAVKAAPGVIKAIASKKASPKAAILQGLKRAGSRTAAHTFGELTSKKSRQMKKRKVPLTKPRPKKRRQMDIFQ